MPDMDGGGAQRTFVNLANALPDEGIEPVLVTARGDGPAKEWLHPSVRFVDLGSTQLRGALLLLRRFIQREQPEVVAATIADANVIAWFAAYGTSAKTVGG